MSLEADVKQMARQLSKIVNGTEPVGGLSVFINIFPVLLVYYNTTQDTNAFDILKRLQDTKMTLEVLKVIHKC